MRPTKTSRPHTSSETIDYGLRSNVIHTPSSGYGYSEAEEFEWERSTNPNIRYVPDEPNRDLARRWSRRQTFEGRGPKNYRRSDERVFEDVCEVLSRHPFIDASEISISVKEGLVTLEGLVETRRVRRLAEEVIVDLLGVRDVENHIKVKPHDEDLHRIAHSLA